MKIVKDTAAIQRVVRSNNGLHQYLKQLECGRDATPRSWLYESVPADNVLDRWLHTLRRVKNDSPFGEEFYQFDIRQVEKFGPQGKIPPVSSSAVYEAVEPVFKPSAYDDQNSLESFLRDTKPFAEHIFGSENMLKHRPISLTNVLDDMADRDTLSTNSGFPRFTRRSKVKLAEVEDAESGKALSFPAIALFRFYYGKLRLVWMYPMSMNLLEFSFTQKIQFLLRNSPRGWVKDYLSPWLGFEYVKQTLTKQWKGQEVVGGDTTKMDAHMRSSQIRIVFEIVKWVFQEKYWTQLYDVLTRVNTIPLLIDSSQMLIGKHGLASGSGWTQLSETVVQLFLAWRSNRVGQGIGDDLFWTPSLSAVEFSKYMESFGLPANPEKQTVSQEYLHFLQRYYRQGFFSREADHVLGAYYPTIRSLESLIYPERFHSPKQFNSDIFCVRVFTILENCVDDPWFVEFLKFVVKGSKHLIPFAKQAAKQINSAQAASRLIPGLNPSYNQEKKEKPLSSYQSIQIAKTL